MYVCMYVKLLNGCQISFGFLPAKSQIFVRTASFLQKFTVSENSLRTLFANRARRQLAYIIFLYNFVTTFCAMLFLPDSLISHSCC